MLIKKWFLAGLVVVATVAAVHSNSRAAEPETASCMLRVVHALPSEGGVDSRLAPLKSRFLRPPFLHWKKFALLSEEQRTLKPTESAEYNLPDGRKARLVYAEHEESGGKHHVRGSFAIEGGKSSSRTMFSLDEGGILLIAGQAHEGGILIYALSCDTRS